MDHEVKTQYVHHEGSRHTRPPILQRLRYVVILTLLRLIFIPVNWFQHISRRNKFQPSYIRRYKCRPALPIRVFVPESSAPNAPQRFPVLFTIHGGGFVTGNPKVDDEPNHTMASEHCMAVVALNYTKYPFARHPSGVEDVEALLLAALNDDTLPLDRTSVAVSGYSTGGQLALGLCQRPKMRALPITAVIVQHGSIDFTSRSPTMDLTRPYKPMLGGMRGKDTDMGYELNPAFKWFYAPYGIDLRDPLLSPAFAPRKSLPPHVFFLQAELDHLTGETLRTACRLAGRPVPDDVLAGRGPPSITAEAWTQADRERFAWEDEASGVRLLLVPDALHCFDSPSTMQLFDADTIQDAAAKSKVTNAEIGQWLWRVWVTRKQN
ncbi:uncharacterized protein TRIVIDRAFT_141683 [Trichoderma virens Gv29-8]|uniref:Alpha/beta hydrolase fold-3 domain-containing protein n=1 Tax=Hypocrea virens (strain Gv29-8 / FGSC 10586) TaxID=413071 RepID=G9MGA8_HYPVG|nr:uncharacterized protein TRIVIDRAFT_141683 [Trichoderma virens Gv29-8]EHK26557.1 hypothetical protein TRIVIDRAFT_141683 [Trichoderma virens Gv29-8]